MESWGGLSYADIMDMPTTRRHRLIRKKSDLEKKREEHQKAEASRARSRSKR
jgi:hypothetical protein